MICESFLVVLSHAEVKVWEQSFSIQLLFGGIGLQLACSCNGYG